MIWGQDHETDDVGYVQGEEQAVRGRDEGLGLENQYQYCYERMYLNLQLNEWTLS